MSTPCTNCKDSILNKTPTLIGSPLCNGDCPEEYVCLDITPAGCVSIQGKEDCITNGDTVQEQIDNIRDYVCNTVASQDIYVKVNSNDAVSGYLFDKFSPGDVYPVLDTTDITAPKVKFVKQVKKFSTTPQSIVDNSETCDQYYANGVIINTNWNVISDTFLDTSDITVSGTAFVIKPGVYNISIVANLSSETAFTSAPGFTHTQLKLVGGGGNVIVIARGIIICTEEKVSFASAETKGITIASTSSYNVNIFNKSGNTLNNNNANVDITFEKIG